MTDQNSRLSPNLSTKLDGLRTARTIDVAPDPAAHWIQGFDGPTPEGAPVGERFGLAIEPFDLKPEQIVISNIARSLGNQCRFGGHVRRFYSVALHSVAVMKLAELIGMPTRVQLWALLHDAGESLSTPDIVNPVKKHPMFTAWRAQERVIDERVRAHLGLSDLSTAELNQVITCDLALITPEKRDLLNKAPREWGPLPTLEEAAKAYAWAWEDMREHAGETLHTSDASAALFLWHFARLSSLVAQETAT